MGSSAEQQGDPFRKALGLPEERRFREEDPPRPPDRQQLRLLATGMLDNGPKEEVLRLITAFREWNDAYLEEVTKASIDEREKLGRIRRKYHE